MKHTPVIVLVAVAAVAAASFAYAAIPAANGTISACKDQKGALKVIDAEAGQTCPSGQQLLTWSQDGWAEIAPRLAQPGTLNAAGNPVDWTKLKGVPAGFADGLDNGVDQAGFGLKLSVFPQRAFAVDTTKVQQRVSGTCTAGQTIQSIAADGTVACAGPSALSAADNSTGIICNDWCYEGSLSLPAGTFAVTAKVQVRQTNDTEYDRLRVDCRLDASGSTVDRSETFIRAFDIPKTVLPLQSVVTLTSPGNVAVACKDGGVGDAKGEYLRIMAVRVA
jgi:opacity protein-like surface antigen